LLYFFLAAVSDKSGLSFWSDTTIAVRTRLDENAVARAREELVRHDLVAYQVPLTQVLTLPQRRLERAPSEPSAIGDLLRGLRGGKP
jgi:hypothetical protein